jgi:hypothetical protein
MKTMMSLVPEAAEDIFQNFVVKDLKNFLELFLTCPDKHVRYYCSQIALHAINVIIAHRGFELNPQKLTEKVVLYFMITSQFLRTSSQASKKMKKSWYSSKKA